MSNNYKLNNYYCLAVYVTADYCSAYCRDYFPPNFVPGKKAIQKLCASAPACFLFPAWRGYPCYQKYLALVKDIVKTPTQPRCRNFDIHLFLFYVQWITNYGQSPKERGSTTRNIKSIIHYQISPKFKWLNCGLDFDDIWMEYWLHIVHIWYIPDIILFYTLYKW